MLVYVCVHACVDVCLHQCTLRKGTRGSSRNVRHAGNSNSRQLHAKWGRRGREAFPDGSGREHTMVRGPKRCPTLILWPAGSPSSSGTQHVPLAWAGRHTQGEGPVELSARLQTFLGESTKSGKAGSASPVPGQTQCDKGGSTLPGRARTGMKPIWGQRS